MRTTLPHILFLLAGSLTLAACNVPNDVTRAAAVVSGDFTNGEILQVIKVINDGEITQSELVTQRSENQSVQNLARRIMDDHTSSNQRINSMVEAGYNLNRSPLSRGLSVQVDQVRDDLQGMQGVAFDCAYLNAQIEQHELALENIRVELQPDADDQNVATLLAETIPGLEGHLTAAREARSAMNQCPGN